MSKERTTRRERQLMEDVERQRLYDMIYTQPKVYPNPDFKPRGPKQGFDYNSFRENEINKFSEKCLL